MSNVFERARRVLRHSSIHPVAACALCAYGLTLACSSSPSSADTPGAGAANAGAAGSLVAGAAGNAAAGASGSSESGAGGTSATGGASGGFGASGGPSQLDPEGYQAEVGFFSGGVSVASSVAAFTGTGYLTNFTTTGAQVIFAVNVPAAGAYDVSLRAGLNTVTYRREASDNGAVEVDSLLLPGGLSLATRGATTAYAEYEAEAGTQTGTLIGPSRDLGTVPAEASGRKAVRLDAIGQEVAFTLTAAANALVVRYSIPDSADGVGSEATLGLYAGDAHVQDIPLDSQYSWVYGAYPFTGPPSAGSPHHYFDERRVLIGEQPAGTVIHLRKDAAAEAASYVIDLVDFEEVPPVLAMPEGFISITSHGATKDDGQDDTAAIEATVAEAQSSKKGVFVPEGTFEIASHINLNAVSLVGAGKWYSVLHGKNGKGGVFGQGGRIALLDFAISGDVRYRNDGEFDTGVEGNFGEGSLIQNVWIEHTKVGLWLDAPTLGTYAVGMRIRNTFADGVNLHKGTSNARVDQSSIRNTGDDALAMFSEALAVKGCGFTFNTVQVPLLANGIGIYGGADNRAEDNLISDTVSASAGIAVSTRFNPVAFSGTQSVQRNTLTRTGGFEPNWKSEFGALWVYADPSSSDITTPVVVKDVEILDSTYQGVLISYNHTVSGLLLERVTVRGTGSFGIDIQAQGSATLSGVAVSDSKKAALNNPGGYSIQGTGNTGF